MVQSFELVRQHVVAMAVDPDRVVKGFDILEHQLVRKTVIRYAEPAQPLALDKRMEGFDAGVIVFQRLKVVRLMPRFLQHSS